MKMKKVLSIALFVTMILSLLAFPTSAAAWDGTTTSSSLKGEGTQASPYLVETAEDLAFLANDVNDGNSYAGKYITQTANIDLGNKEWTPIGKRITTAAAPFSGVYSGLGHSITNLKITKADDTVNLDIGLFGYVTSTTELSAGVANLTVSGEITLTALTANYNIGGIVGMFYKDNSTVVKTAYGINLTSKVNINVSDSTGEPRIGGITGEAFLTSLENCVNNGNLTVTSAKPIRAAGIVGQTNRSTIKNCINNGDITVTAASAAARAGGITSVVTRGGSKGDESNPTYTILENCINNGKVSAKSDSTAYAAGIAANFYVNKGTWAGLDLRVKFINCINTADIKAESTATKNAYAHAGGLGGYTENGNGYIEVSGCINTGSITSIGGAQERAGGMFGSIYSKDVTTITFDKCLASGALKGGCFSFKNSGKAFDTSTANADEATITAAVKAVKAKMGKSTTKIEGFDTSKGLVEEKPSNPSTGDYATVLVLVAVFSLAGVAVAKKSSVR